MLGIDTVTLKSLGLIKQRVQEKNFEICVNTDSITGSYTNDLNILELNECVLKIIEYVKKKKLIELEKIKNDETYKISGKQYAIERNHSIELLKSIDKDITAYEQNIKKTEYISKASSILNEYKIVGTLKKYVTFGKGEDDNTVEDVNKKINRLSLIEKYLDVTKKYVDINIYRKSTIKGCTLCGYDISEIESVENENIICPSCNIEITDIVRFKNETNNNIKRATSNYEGRLNFINELHRFQGRPIKSKIPNNLTELLDTHFIKKGFPICNVIKNNPKLLKETSKDLMSVALKAIGLSSLYKDINLICNLYWGYDLVNLENLESQIMEKYDSIDKVLEDIRDDRSSSLNTKYELWWILSLLDYQCVVSDFKIPKTPEIFQYHEKKREQICKILNWKYVPLNYMSI